MAYASGSAAAAAAARVAAIAQAIRSEDMSIMEMAESSFAP